MYEELLPIWKARCRSLAGGGPVGYEWGRRLDAIRRNGGTLEWVLGSSEKWLDCIVNGCMLFTWEQGIAED